MRKAILTATLVAMLAGISGCVVIVKEEERKPGGSCRSTDATIAEIDAVESLSFDANRRDAYNRIAARDGLSDAAQVHLVEAVFENLSFENSKQSVLLTLIGNRGFSDAARRVILDRLNDLAFENTRQRLLEAMDQRKC